MDDDELTVNERRFVGALVAGEKFNLAAAYTAAFGTEKRQTAGALGGRLARKPRVAEAIKKAEQERLARLRMTADDVLEDAYHVANTSPNEVVQYRIGPCRYCHGIDHKYQNTPKEFREKQAYYFGNPLNKRDDPLGLKFDVEGGVGYDARLDPHPDCPECFGEGIGRIVGMDTRNLTKAASRIYAGAKHGKHGPELLLRSRDKAHEIAARSAGLANGTYQLTMGPGTVVPVVAITTTDPVEAARQYQELMKGGG